MLGRKEKELHKEVFSRILKKIDVHESKNKKLLDKESMLDILQEISETPRIDLEKITNEVIMAYADDFFSIKTQLILANIFMLLFASIFIIPTWLFVL